MVLDDLADGPLHATSTTSPARLHLHPQYRTTKQPFEARMGALHDMVAAAGKCIDQGATYVVVAPYFLSKGRHIQQDIPQIVAAAREEYPSTSIVVAEPIGEPAQPGRPAVGPASAMPQQLPARTTSQSQARERSHVHVLLTPTAHKFASHASFAAPTCPCMGGAPAAATMLDATPHVKACILSRSITEPHFPGRAWHITHQTR
jgi:hypothetical protein